jgi:hypothetical protein
MYVAVSVTNINMSISNIQNCLTAVHVNGLAINLDKSEAVIISTAQLALMAIKHVDVASCATVQF